MARHPDYHYTLYPWNVPPDWIPDAPGLWEASTAYILGEYCQPTVSNEHVYIVTTAGTSHALEPTTWPLSGTVTDGTVVWTESGSLVEWKMGYWYEPTTSPFDYLGSASLDISTRENKQLPLEELIDIEVEYSDYSRLNTLKKHRNPYNLKDFVGSWRGLTVDPAATDIFHKVTSKDKNRLDLISYQYYETTELWWVVCLANRNVISNPINVSINIILRIPDLARIHREILE